jgi:hypothetical protein
LECGLVDDARAQSSPRLQKKIEGILPVLTVGFGDRVNGGVRPAVKRRRRWWCSVSGDWGRGEKRRRGAPSAVQRGRGGGAFYRAGETVRRRGAAGGVEFYFSSVLKELKGEEETGRCRFSGGSEGGMMALRFGSSRMEEGGRQQRTAQRRGWRGGSADGSRRWEPMETGGRSRWKDENGPSDEMGRKPRRL